MHVTHRGSAEPRCPVVRIVGGGMAGTLTAVQLLRQARRPLEIVLVDRSGVFGPGVAYSTRSDQHLLNQPAARMSGFAEAPDHFRTWAEARSGRGDPCTGRDVAAALCGSLGISVRPALRDRPALELRAQGAEELRCGHAVERAVVP